MSSDSSPLVRKPSSEHATCVPELLQHGDAKREFLSTNCKCSLVQRCLAAVRLGSCALRAVPAGNLVIVLGSASVGTTEPNLDSAAAAPPLYVVLTRDCHRAVLFALLVLAVTAAYVGSCVLRGPLAWHAGSLAEAGGILAVAVVIVWLQLRCVTTDPSIASVPPLPVSARSPRDAIDPMVELPEVRTLPFTATTTPPRPTVESTEDDRRQAVTFSNVDGYPTSALMYRHDCSACRVRRPIRCSHCREANVCVHGSDHHCGVLGACIGRGNIKFFVGVLVFSAIFTDWILCGSLVCFLSLRTDGSESCTVAVSIGLAFCSMLSFLQLNAAAGFYVYLYLFLGHVTLREYRKGGSLIEGYDLETAMWSRVPRPFTHGSFWDNLKGLVRLKP